MKNHLLLAACCLIHMGYAIAQPCTPAGDQTTPGTNNTWIGYVYHNMNFTDYAGYVTEGNITSPAFDQQFGGDNVTYATNGCDVQTETFSVRYKLIKTFTAGIYTVTVGGDDGYRLSFDNGATWAVDNFTDHGYTTSVVDLPLNGTYNMVLEYFENAVNNRVSFDVTTSCTGIENTSICGTGNIWRGYVYDGTNFNNYKGMVLEGVSSNPSFDQSFGGDNVSYATSGCPVQTETFSVRYRLTKTFANGSYLFSIGGDDGYRLSFDDGVTWAVDRWWDQSYNSVTYTANLHGTYNMVIEFYENGGGNRISFAILNSVPLPIHLLSFNAKDNNGSATLDWSITTNSDPDYFLVEKSSDGNNFTAATSITGTAGVSTGNSIDFLFTDPLPYHGTSYYRLKMVDRSGVVVYSKVATLHLSSPTQQAVMIFPTIVTNKSISIKSTQTFHDAVIRLTKIDGQLIESQVVHQLPAGTTLPVRFSTGLLLPGIYLVSITDARSNTVRKIWIQ